jgi:hypothetical protein
MKILASQEFRRRILVGNAYEYAEIEKTGYNNYEA